MNFDRFFPKRNKQIKEKKPIKILPEDVRYALQYKKAQLNKADIEVLARSGFLDEAFYLTSKSLVDNPIKHKAFLEKYFFYILSNDNKKPEIQKLILDTLEKENSAEMSVTGTKLAQISRQGFDLWQEKFQSLASELSNDERNIFLLAHSPFVGLSSFFPAFAEKRKALNILIPEWLENQEFGYTIDFQNNQMNVDWLRKPFNNKRNSVLIDDTINTGNTLDKFIKFLVQNGSKEPKLKVLFG